MIRKLFLMFFFISLFSVLNPSLIKAQCGSSPITNVGPEIAESRAGEHVIAAQNFNGVVSVINYLRRGGEVEGELIPVNTVPIKDLNPINVLRVDIDHNTPAENLELYAQRLRDTGPTEFPCGIKMVILSVEANNLDPEFYNWPGGDLVAAGREYAQKFNIFAAALGGAYPLAPAPPDLFNGKYNADPWLDGFNQAINCSYVTANAADIFELTPTAGSGYTWLNIHEYQASRMCNIPVTHFEGWGINPNEPAPGPEVKDQVIWYQSHTPPVETASTLILPICNRERVYPYWWYYLNGKVFTPDGTEIDPENCGAEAIDYCSYNAGYLKSDPEFHSLRPYPACPLYNEVAQTNYFLCGHDLIAAEVITINSPYDPLPDHAITKNCGLPSPEGVTTCTYVLDRRPIRIDVDLSETKLPIMGLTEGPYVNNEEYRPFGDLTNTQKVNEYVSWYLNGVNDRAEGNLLKVLPNYPEGRDLFPEGYEDTRDLIDFSGPLKKLLPLRVQSDQRVEQIERADASLDENPPGQSEESRHDQIVACYYQMNDVLGIAGLIQGGWRWLMDILEFDELFSAIGIDYLADVYGDGSLVNTMEKIPGPCYPENEDDADVDLGIFGSIDLINIEKLRLTKWLNEEKLPPKRENYTNFKDYWKDYRRWRGEFCLPTILGFYLCYDDPGNLARPNFWGTLFSYIPFSSTEDRVGYAEAELSQTAQPPSDIKDISIVFEPDIEEGKESGKRHFLFFPHMQESAELGQLTQGLFVPGADPETQSESDKWLKDGAFTPENSQWFYNTDRCEIVEARVNPGDRLHGDKDEEDLYIGGELLYSGYFTCEFKPVPNETCITECAGDQACVDSCQGYEPCKIKASTAISIYNATPKVEEIWERFVSGQMSIFKRFYPKFGPDTPVEELKDIPAESDINLSSSVETTAGDPGGGRPGSQAKIYFPHIGSVYDYFLKGIQEALLPLGMSMESGGSPLPPSGGNPDIFETIDCPTSTPALQNSIPGILCSVEGICNATAADVSDPRFLGSIKAKAVDLALRWIDEGEDEEGNPKPDHSNIEACYYEVVKRSLAAQINPIYALAIWIQESDASNYDGVASGGTVITSCDPDSPATTVQDFGINKPDIAGNFDAQSKRFMYIPYLYPVDYPQCFPSGCSIATFSRVYQQGASATCEMNSAAISYAEKTLRTMQAISPGCQPKYPTDMSCP